MCLENILNRCQRVQFIFIRTLLYIEILKVCGIIIIIYNIVIVILYFLEDFDLFRIFLQNFKILFFCKKWFEDISFIYVNKVKMKWELMMEVVDGYLYFIFDKDIKLLEYVVLY